MKSYPGVVALAGADLQVQRGEVHALVGQNGAGKSTLIKILTGAERRDGGLLRFNDRPINFGSPQEAQQQGISTIYQEINLVGYRSVAENIFMGREPRRWGFINWRSMNREAARLLDQVGVHIDVRQPLMSFNIAIQQMVAIARAVSFRSQLVVMDEPTSSLDDQEVETLFAVIRSLRDQGVSVVFITHRLDELYAVCDRVTIMRDGRTVAQQPMQAVSKLELVASMLGRETGEVEQRGATGFDAASHRGEREPLLEASHLRRGRTLQDGTVSVGKGEIVGLAGLLGSGRTEVARVVFGADRPDAGSISYNGRRGGFTAPAKAIQAGVGFCSEDRKAEGIIPHLSVRENLTLAALPALSRHGVVDRTRQRELVDRFIDRLGIRTAGPDQPVRELSGGNQQKVLLARWLCLNPKLLILDEPTRGIDVGAKMEIQSLIDELAREGLGVLMISSEIDELTEGSDQVTVLRDGRTVATLDRGQISQDAVIDAMVHAGESPTVTTEG